MHILIVEDNPDIIANLYGFLEPLGYTLDVARSGTAGLSQATSGTYDAIVLDLSLPGMDGLELCRRLRKEYRLGTPILMLTARDTVQNKITGFDAGADDYLVKPYSLLELDARLKALVRRSKQEHVEYVLKFDELELDTSTGRITRAGQELSLTPTGLKIITVLLREAPKLVRREVLEREIWSENPPDSDALRTHIHALRQALDKSFDWPMLRTVPGTGYQLVGPHEN
ncbi:response regulator transcription factor [Oxalobacteraceae bacterium R-40]|uniref:Response regulator transcription factor n=1 Tax=Keguizhuia sedimenti TaxID=3064264 RepID=A0ABU1BNL0_9BURK|nr:response regulator transcription factor [Oxalobacteraceae bacterium R-40]